VLPRASRAASIVVVARTWLNYALAAPRQAVN